MPTPSSPENFEIVRLKSGVNSIRDLATGEICHPGIGPMEEALHLHVRQQRLKQRAASAEKFVIWDVGLGGAANAIAALEELQGSNAQIELHSFDYKAEITRFALAHANELGYVAPWANALAELLAKGFVAITPKFRWVYHFGDFRQTMAQAVRPHAVFYDPYSSAKNQELWTLQHLKNMRSCLEPGCTLTNYSASSAVRVTWLLAGYFVGAGVAVGKKTETLFASTSLTAIEKPLGPEWLLKMPRSQSSAPIRDAVLQPAPISAEDYSELKEHPQFL